MAGAEAEQSEVEAEPNEAKAPALRGLFKFARLSAAERTWARLLPQSGFSRGADSGGTRIGVGGGGGGSPPPYGTGILVYLYPIPA